MNWMHIDYFHLRLRAFDGTEILESLGNDKIFFHINRQPRVIIDIDEELIKLYHVYSSMGKREIKTIER